MAEARRVQKTYIDTDTQTTANENRPPLRMVDGGKKVTIDSTRNASTQTKSTNADRNVKKSYQAPRGQQDIATQFQDSYAKQGLQPQGLVGNEVTQQRQQYQQPEQLTRSGQTQQKQRGLVKRGVGTINRRRKFRKRNVAKRAFAKVRVTRVNIWIWSWGLWSWAMFQLPFALLSLLFMTLAEFIHQLFVERSLLKSDDPGKYADLYNKTIDGILTILSVTASIIDDIFEWFGINLDTLSPTSMFLVTYLITLLFGWFTLMLIYFMYKGSFLRPLSGKGSALKISTFLLAIIGYAIPIMNLFPWFIFWTMAVWWHPK